LSLCAGLLLGFVCVCVSVCVRAVEPWPVLLLLLLLFDASLLNKNPARNKLERVWLRLERGKVPEKKRGTKSHLGGLSDKLPRRNTAGNPTGGTEYGGSTAGGVWVIRWPMCRCLVVLVLVPALSLASLAARTPPALASAGIRVGGHGPVARGSTALRASWFAWLWPAAGPFAMWGRALAQSGQTMLGAGPARPVTQRPAIDFRRAASNDCITAFCAACREMLASHRPAIPFADSACHGMAVTLDRRDWSHWIRA